MKNKSTLVAVALLLGLGSWYYFYEVKGKAAREQAKDDAKLVFQAFDPAAVQEIMLHQVAGGDVALKKAGGAWHMVTPLQADVDQGAVGSLLDSAKALKKEDTVDDSGANAADYGMTAAAQTATFAMSSSSSKTIYFGIDNPTGQYAYAQVKGQAPVFLVMRYSKSNLMKSAADLRDKKVWDFDPDKLSLVRSSFGKGLTLGRGKDGKLALLAPFKKAGDEGAIGAWLNQLKALRIDTFVDDQAKNAAKYGLASSTASLELQSGSAPPWVLIQGKKLDGNKGRYYMLKGGHMVFSLADYNAATLEKKAEDLAVKPTPTPAPTPLPAPASPTAKAK